MSNFPVTLILLIIKKLYLRNSFTLKQTMKTISYGNVPSYFDNIFNIYCIVHDPSSPSMYFSLRLEKTARNKSIYQLYLSQLLPPVITVLQYLQRIRINNWFLWMIIHILLHFTKWQGNWEKSITWQTVKESPIVLKYISNRFRWI